MARVDALDLEKLGGVMLGDVATLQAAKAKKQAAAKAALWNRWSTDSVKVKSKRIVVDAPPSTVTGGKVQVAATSFWTDWNKKAKELITPVAPAIRASPLPTSVQTKIINTPLDALLDTFEPIEDAVGRAVDRVLAQTGSTHNYFGTRKNLTRVQEVDKKTDASTQRLMLSLRTFDAFVVLFVCKPIELAAACLREGIDIAKEMAAWTIDAAGQVVTSVVDTGKAALDTAASWFGLGEPATGISVAGIVISETVVFGVVIDQIITVILTAIVAAIIAAISAFGISLASGESPQTAANYALYAALTAGTSIVATQLPALISKATEPVTSRTTLPTNITKIPGLDLSARTPVAPASEADRVEPDIDVVDEELEDVVARGTQLPVGPTVEQPRAGMGVAPVLAAAAVVAGALFLATRKR